jgi:hypothetical protein
MQLATNWKTVGHPTTWQLFNSLLHRRVVEIDTPSIHGSVIRLPGLEATITDVLVRVEFVDGTNLSTILKPDQP